ncbi:tetratricopeptide repeat protein [Actinosynnema sp. NPDC023587]|uniref:tetratricopeptide repeat protein n=1 Tax=Actinosynnema sp. NPDC023587 TaxID=3154695 RepID=UPI0033F0E054
MTSPDNVLSVVRFCMTKGEVDEAVELLGYLWAALPSGRPEIDVPKLHGVSLELADRFPVARSVSTLLYGATVTYAKLGDFPAATVTASRMVSVWRASCQANPTHDALSGHAHSLDTLASVYRARGMNDGVIACLVELVEWNFTCGNQVGVAWALRELGALAFLSGKLDNAAKKFARADELYAEDAGDPSIAQERAECHVLLGRLAHEKGDADEAVEWFEKALDHLEGGAAEEVRELIGAIGGGRALPPPGAVQVGEFGRPIWNDGDAAEPANLPRGHDARN